MPGSFEGTKAVSVNGVTLAYREQGVGEPVVLVHGASDLRIWEHQEIAVADAFRSIAYSRRYARPNADIEPDIDDQMLPHVEDLAALLNALRAAPAHLVGHSWGGFVALLTAVRSGHLAVCQHAAEADRDFAASGHPAVPSCIRYQVWHHGDQSGPASIPTRRRRSSGASIQRGCAGAGRLCEHVACAATAIARQ
jgi:pimeloyl-ACP methyl ester carboxylesterase